MNKTNRVAGAGAAVLLAITLSACATRMGSDFDDDYARQIKPGETTKAEVRDRLGRPALVSRAGDEYTWTYAYYRAEGFAFAQSAAPEGRQKRLVVTFKGDSVKEAKFTQELPLPNLLEEPYR